MWLDVLLHDQEIGEYFVCKKYVPFSEPQRQELFAHLVREIKLLAVKWAVLIWSQPFRFGRRHTRSGM